MSITQKECIVVLGMHRSGTSVLTGLLSILGGDVGSDIMQPTQDNPKGYFENNYIYHLNRKILHEQHADWDTIDFDFSSISQDKFDEYVQEAQSILKREFKYVRHFVIKDPRVCYLFPIWEKALLNLNVNLKVIFPIRSPLEVARSLQKRNSFTTEQGIHLWASHVFKAEKYSRPYSRETIFYPQDYSNTEKLTSRLCRFFSTSPSNDAIKQAKEFYTPSLSHHNIGFDNLSALPNTLAKLISLLQRNTLLNEDFDVLWEQYSTEAFFYTQPDQILFKDKENKLLSEQKLLTDETKSLAVENRALTARSKKLEQDLKSLTESKSGLQDKYQALVENNNELQKRHKIHVESKNELQRRHQILAESKNELQLRHQVLADSKSEIQIKHEIVANNNKELQKKHQELSGQLKDLTNRHQSLAQSKNDLLKRHEVLAESKNELRKLHNELAESKKELEKRHQALAESKNELAKKHQTLAESKNELTKRHQALADSKDELAKKYDTLVQRNNDLAKRHQVLVDSKNELTERHKALVENNSELKKQYHALSSVNGELQQDNLSLTDKNREIKKQYQILEENNNITVSERDHLRTAYSDIKQELSLREAFVKRLKGDIDKLLEKIDKIEGYYHRMRINRDSKNSLIEEKDFQIAYLSNRLQNSDELINDLSTKTKHAKKLARLLNSEKLSKTYQKKWYWPIVRKPLATKRKKLMADSGLFSPIYYLTSYPDVRKSGIPPLEHFYKYGWRENRRPSEAFDLKAYAKAYPDVAEAGVNPLLHYLEHGQKEGRAPTPPTIKVVETSTAVATNRPTSHNVSTTREKTASAPVVETQAQPILTDLKQHKSYGPVIPRHWDTKLSVIKRLGQGTTDISAPIPKDVVNAAKEQIGHASQPLVSVIMPSWNRGDVIHLAIDSVLRQSYSNLELIISDDGSTDDTLSLIESKYSQAIADNKLKLVRNPHKGVCQTRNAGLRVAQGQLIAYLDSDNQWREDFLLMMVSAFIENDELNCAYSALLVRDNNRQLTRVLSTPYSRKQLLTSNFIDMNVFVHRASLYRQYGGFDETLTRLVDWELIIRYTRFYEPARIPFIGVDYYLDHDKFSNITTTVNLDDNRNLVNKKHFLERVRYDLDSLKLAYVLWDFPALSQTFVINELRWLVAHNYDVKVYYAVTPDKAATLDFEIESFQTKNPEELVPLLREHNRNYCHSHFAYPAVTKLTWPACSELKLPFTFMPHAVDIFHHENQKRNHVGEIAQSSLCQKVFVHGQYHKSFLKERGVPVEKMAFNFQAVNLDEFLAPSVDTATASQSQPGSSKATYKGIVLSRFVEKKGISSLIDTANLLQNEPVHFELYGYGPLEAEYKEQIEKLNLTNIRLMGALESKDQVRDLYSACDFLIAPCVEAKNGDRDGFPTVILEAFSMGVPVITTDIAAIPDYLTDEVHALIAPAGDTEAIANKVRQIMQMPDNRKQALIRQSKHFLQTKVGTHLCMSLLTDTWFDKRIDIFLVSFNNDQYNDEAETLEIIRRIFKYTTTPFTLTIIDNNSDESFWLNILKQVEGRDNVRLIRKELNLMCGPSSNIALEMGDGEFAIYICAKEGFIGQHGWERTLLNAMREEPNAAIGGHHAHMPKYVYGHEYETHPDFSKFRNQDFIVGRKDKPFTHIQGGVFIIRREVFAKHGGFTPLIPHGGMDIELSFYYESLGYKLLEIPEVASLTVKTRPTLTAIMDKNTVIAHPLTIKSAEKQLDSLSNPNLKHCNICGWQGKSYSKKAGCPECGSTAEGRLVYQYIASNYRIYRKDKALLLGHDKGLASALAPLFTLEQSTLDTFKLTPDLRYSCIISLTPVGSCGELYKIVKDDGIIVSTDDGSTNISDMAASSITYYDRKSTSIEYGWKRLIIVNKAY